MVKIMSKQELDVEDIKKDIKEVGFVTECKIKGESYVSKEEFINIINVINFKAIRRANLDLITDILIKPKNQEMEIISKQIDID